jgi:hypothetical protein
MSETRKTALGLGALALLVLMFYLPTLSGRFVFGDDFAYFYPPTPVNSTAYIRALEVCGRPLTAQYLRVCHWLIHLTGNPNLAHLPGLLGVLLLSLASFVALRWCQLRAVPALLLCIVLLTLPPVQLCVAYLNCGSYGWAALMGALALLVLAPALRPDAGFGLLLSRGAAAWFLLLVGQCFYQPTALYYWSLAAAALLCGQCADWREFRARAAPLFTIGLTAMASYVVAFKLYYWARGWPALPRAELASDLGDKFLWFWNLALPEALSLWVVPFFLGSRHLLWLAAAGVIVELCRRCTGKKVCVDGNSSPLGTDAGKGVGLVLTRWAAVACVLFLSYAFNLVLKENWAAYRTTLAFTATAVVILFFSLERVASLLGPRLGRSTLSAVLMVAAATGAYLGSTDLMGLVILPRITEFEFVKTRLIDSNLYLYRSIHIIRPDVYQGLAPSFAYEEFGTPSSALPWGANGLVVKALADLHYEGPTPPITQSGPNDPTPPAADAFVIDMRKMFHLNPYWPRR